MVGLYVALHFGKPAGETIGSFFGGYILGVLAYKSKNIWGGIIAHMGIAWLMELFAYLQKTYNP
jgi:membrane protease YdiL (CAAX protease family)